MAQKILHHFFLYALTLPNINRFSKLFQCQNQEKICNNTVTEDPTTLPSVSLHYLVKCQCRKSNNENKTTSVTTYFKEINNRKQQCLLSQLLSKVTVTSCRYYIRVAQKLGIIFVRLIPSSKINWFSLIAPFGQRRRRLECVVQQQGGHIDHFM